MKLDLLCGSVVFLIVGITLAGDSLEVMAQSQEGLKKYENGKYGISFQYPSSWEEPIELGCNIPSQGVCMPTFIILKNYSVTVLIKELDKSTGNALKDFVAWDYTKTDNENRTFINDNLTVIGKNYSAWQTETEFSDSGDKDLTVYAVNGNVGYDFSYLAPADNHFSQHLDEFKNMLKTVTLTPPTPEKKPSFLNSSQIANSSILPSTPTVQDKSLKIVSSNDFIDSIGYFHVVGEVENNTPSTAEFVQITGTFYDSNNQVVGTQFTYTNPYDIDAGQKAPFDLALLSASIPTSQIDHYNLQANSQ